MLQFTNTFIHHVKPGRRYQGQEHHARVAGGHLGRVFVVAQHLVLAAGHIVMVAVATKFKEHYAANHMVAVPAVLGLGPLVFARSNRLTLQAVVFNIVDGFQ